MIKPRLLEVCATLVAISAWGCGPKEGATKTTASPPTAVEPSAEVSPLDSIKDAEFQTLRTLAASWMLSEKVDSVSDAQTQLQLRVDRLTSMESENAEKLAVSIEMMMKLIELEKSLKGKSCDGPCLDSRIDAYRILQTWNMLIDVKVMRPLFDGAMGMFGVSLPPDKIEELRKFFRSGIAKAKQNWRAVSIVRIRYQGTSEARKMELLEELAQVESRRLAYKSAAGLYNLALPLAKGEERGQVEMQMAILCYRQLDVPCGDQAHARARSSTLAQSKDKDAGYATHLQIVRSAAMRISRNDTSTIEARLQRGYDFIDLVRFADAKAIFDVLRKEHTSDARPVVGLASILIEDGFHTGRAHQLLVEARGLEHRELGYYELRIGTWFEDFKTLDFNRSEGPELALEALSVQIRELEEAIEDYALLVPDKGRALRYAVEIGEVMIQMQLGRKEKKDLRKALDAGIPEVNRLLENKAPTLYLRRLQLILSRFDIDGKRALASVGRKESLAELTNMHAGLRFALVMVHNTGHEQFASDQQSNASFVGRDLRSAALAVVALQKKDKTMWTEVETLLEGLVSEAPDEDNRFRLTNNLAVVKYRLGKVGEAQSMLRSVLVGKDKVSVASINAPAMDKDSGPDAFASLSGAGEADLLPGAKVAARRWIARKEKGRKLRAKENAALAATVSQLLGRRSFGERGVLLEHTFHLGVGYGTADKLALELAMEVLPWLVLPASE